MKTKYVKSFVLLGLMFLGASCKKKEKISDPVVDTSLEVQKKLDEGIDMQTMIDEYGTEILYGKTYQGGLILKIDNTSKEGIIIAETDQSAGAPWGCTARLGEKELAGQGDENTANIVENCPTPGIAARICDDLVLNGYDDWYLPAIGAFSWVSFLDQADKDILREGSYWSSTDTDETDWATEAHTSALWWSETRYDGFKDSEKRVRAVRKFEF